ncbi:Ig-like domain-containing protein [Providencia hangzhouensis]|uniref:Ig-like domain-containing protein n=1 Tax=Providencia hangzhouensis TaxID=3031799 RepID=UPI0034DD24CE
MARLATISLKSRVPHFYGKAEAGSRVELTIDGQHVVTTADSHGAWSVVTQNVFADGTYHYTVKATDMAGNSTVVTESVQIKAHCNRRRYNSITSLI